MDLHFLTHHARVLAESKIKSKVLDFFPVVGSKWPHQLNDIVPLLAAVANEPLVKACGDAFCEDVESMFGLVQRLAKGHGPSEQAVATMSEWARAVLTRCENYLTTTALKDSASTEMVTYVGRAAMQRLWTSFQAADVASRSLDIAKPFRKFVWMLSATQVKEVEYAVDSGIARYQASLLAPASLCDGSVAGYAAGRGPSTATSGSSSSSSSTSLMKHIGIAATTDSDSKKEDPKKAAKVELMAMFNSRKGV